MDLRRHALLRLRLRLDVLLLLEVLLELPQLLPREPQALLHVLHLLLLPCLGFALCRRLLARDAIHERRLVCHLRQLEHRERVHKILEANLQCGLARVRQHREHLHACPRRLRHERAREVVRVPVVRGGLRRVLPRGHHLVHVVIVEAIYAAQFWVILPPPPALGLQLSLALAPLALRLGATVIHVVIDLDEGVLLELLDLLLQALARSLEGFLQDLLVAAQLRDGFEAGPSFHAPSRRQPRVDAYRRPGLPCAYALARLRPVGAGHRLRPENVWG
mmetsp:Transcript_7644/g.22080  ORF Transcript_7644/g.22080 Transcript_7644/m.22080 type:complete len:276 (+) Transcript_7644:2571-3398(+)